MSEDQIQLLSGMIILASGKYTALSSLYSFLCLILSMVIDILSKHEFTS